MSARHTQRNRSGLQWVAGAIGVSAAAAAVIFGGSPAGAASTVSTQLTLAGVASPGSPTGGTTVGVHPGDTINLSASSLPTAGAPSALGSTLNSLVGGLTGFEVKITKSSVPGLAAGTVLSSVACPGTKQTVTISPAKGTYAFEYSASSVALIPLIGGCTTPLAIDLSGAQIAALSAHNVSVNASNVYTGEVVVATDPPTGGISVQVPGVTVAPSVGPIGLPTIGVPKLPIPTIPVTVPSLPGVPGGPSSSTTAPTPGGGTSHYTPPPTTVPQRVVPSGMTDGGMGGGFGGALPDTGGGAATDGASPLPAAPGAGGATSTAAPIPGGSTKHEVAYASNNPPIAQLPVILAIVAIIALSLVTATYARLYLLRRDTV